MNENILKSKNEDTFFKCYSIGDSLENMLIINHSQIIKISSSTNNNKLLMGEMRKILFFCSCERWTNTEDKFNSLMQDNIPPCKVPGFCATNSCFIENGDVILFFNTRRDNFDDFINAIYTNAPEVYKTEEYKLPMFALIQLYSKFQISYICEKINYEHSFANVSRHDKDNFGQKIYMGYDNSESVFNYLVNQCPGLQAVFSICCGARF